MAARKQPFLKTRLPEENEKPAFRVLSIDGGGVRGLIPARVLQALEELSKTPIAELFDLVVGTSTGGLIALGLLCPTRNKTPQYSAKDICAFYLDKSTQIFQRSFFRTVLTGDGLWAAKYDRKPLDLLLNALFGDHSLSETLLPTIIPTYSLLKDCPALFTSWRSSPHQPDYYMRDIAGATTAAPTYFDPKTFHDLQGVPQVNIDGGIFANNPEIIGVTEALRRIPTLSRDDLYLLSIGTGAPKLNQPAIKLTNAGVIGWIVKAHLIDMMIDADDQWVNEEISALYPNSNRLQVDIPDHLGQMDNASAENLQGLLQATERFIKDNTTVLENVIAKCKR